MLILRGMPLVRRLNRYLTCVYALSCVAGCAATGQDIRVRLIDVRTGRGMPSVPIWLYLGVPKRSWPPHLEATTDSDGSAAFHIQILFDRPSCSCRHRS